MAAPYALPDGLYYVDAAGAQAYAAAKADTEIVLTQAVDVTPAQTLAAWYKFIWFKGGEEVSPGEGIGHVGHTRFTPSLGIEEKIVAAGVSATDDAPGAVAGVVYDVTKPGEYPIATKLTFVRFLPAEGGKTEIVWTVKLTASGETPTSALAKLVEDRVRGGLKMFAKAVNDAVAPAGAKTKL